MTIRAALAAARAVTEAEQALADAKAALDAARDRLDAELASIGWRRLIGGFSPNVMALYHRGDFDAVPQDALLASLAEEAATP